MLLSQRVAGAVLSKLSFYTQRQQERCADEK